MPLEDRRILAAKEAAEYLGVSLATLRKIESRGELVPSRTPGGHRRYSVAMLDEYFERSRRDGNGVQSPDQDEMTHSSSNESEP